jgi:hypothetical protein
VPPQIDATAARACHLAAWDGKAALKSVIRENGAPPGFEMAEKPHAMKKA